MLTYGKLMLAFNRNITFNLYPPMKVKSINPDVHLFGVIIMFPEFKKLFSY